MSGAHKLDGYQEAGKHFIDWISFGTLVATAAGILPSIATMLTIIWMCLRIYESETVKEWRGKKGGE